MTRQTLLPVLIPALLSTMLPVAAAAQAPASGEPARPSGVQRVVSGQLAGSVNEPGLRNTLEVSWTRPLDGPTARCWPTPTSRPAWSA